MPTGYLLIAHGSKHPVVRDEIAHLAGEISEKLGKPPVVYAFLELQKPDIAEAFSVLVREYGCSQIIVLLHFLNSGKHVLTDIPEHLQQLSNQYPDIEVKISDRIGAHKQLSELYTEIIQSCQS